jgi:hypothetical protein
MFGEDVWSTPPLSVNEIGVKFWLDKDNTRYARSKGLTDVVVFYVEDAKNIRTRLITEKGEPLWDDQSLEGILCHIDIMAIARKPY